MEMSELLDQWRQEEITTTILENLHEQSVNNLLTTLGVEVVQDGNQWVALYGEDLQSGVAGFGDTPYQAALAFRGAWYNQKIDRLNQEK